MGHSGHFDLLTVVKTVAVNTRVGAVWTSDLALQALSRSGISGSCGHSVSNLLRLNCLFPTVAPARQVGGFPCLHISPLVISRFPFSSSPSRYKRYCVVLIHISLMTNDVDHLFMVLLAVRVSSLDKCLFKSFACFLNGSFMFLLVLRVLYLFWTLDPY